MRTYTILGIALVESAAIYGLIVAFNILKAPEISGTQAIGAGLAIGLTAFIAGYGEGKLVSGSLNAMNRNPEDKANVLQFMVLFLAMIEASAIYGLIIAQKIISG